MSRQITGSGRNRQLSRREVMVGAAGLSFAFALGGSDGQAAIMGSQAEGRALSPWVSISADGTITIMSPATEMGQGSMTSLPLVLAEELDADWSKVRIVPAPPEDAIYGNPGFGGMMYTAGSNAVRSYFMPMRTFGAQVRRMLIANAAQKLGVPIAELSTEPSTVVHAKSGRRLGYGDIAVFAQLPEKAPEIKPEELKKPTDFRLIGKDVPRVDVPGKVNGTAPYAIDVQVPGMIYGAVLRAPVEGAAPDNIDDSKAKAVAGVLGVVRLPYGVGVLAETPWVAFSAKNALDVTWTKSGKAWGFDSDKGLEEFAAAARDLNIEATEWSKSGDARAALSAAARRVEAEYRCDYAYHAQMEPLNAVASVAASGDSAEVWCGTQSQSMAQEASAKALGIPREKVKLNYLLMGGGFGRRGPRDADFVVDAVLLAKAANRPVKSLWTREDDIHNGRFRPLSAHYLRAGLDPAGKLLACHHRLVADRVTPFFDPVRYETRGRKDFIVMAGADFGGYELANQLVEQVYRDTGIRTAPLRGISWTANKFAVETFIDELALARGVDPVAYRLELIRDPRARKVVETVAAMAEWGKKRENRGMGFAFLNYSDTLVAGAVEISLDRASGQITTHNFWCALDCGIPVQPDNVVAQTESSIVYGLGLALMESITIKDGEVEQSNFYDYRVPRMNEIPAMHIKLMPTDNPPTGAGQMGTPLVTPAIGNAVAQLTGVRLRHAPFAPERVKKALG